MRVDSQGTAAEVRRCFVHRFSRNFAASTYLRKDPPWRWQMSIVRVTR
jgi:hypothetical protein